MNPANCTIPKSGHQYHFSLTFQGFSLADYSANFRLSIFMASMQESVAAGDAVPSPCASFSSFLLLLIYPYIDGRLLFSSNLFRPCALTRWNSLKTNERLIILAKSTAHEFTIWPVFDGYFHVVFDNNSFVVEDQSRVYSSAS